MEKKSIIVEEKTVDEAIGKGIKILNTQIDCVDIEVLEEKSLLSIFNKKVKVKLTEKEIEHEKNSDLNLEDKHENKKFEINIDKDKIKSRLKTNEGISIDIKDLKITDPIDAKVEIDVSNDDMKVYITITPPKGGNMVTKEDIDHMLKEHNIVYGVDDYLINKMILEEQFNQREVIAKGKEVVDGDNGIIKYLFNKYAKGKPEINEYGKVDFKEINIIQHVKKDACLAQKILPTDEIDGMTVTGKVIKAKLGKLVNFKKGKNVVESEDGLKLFAEVDGQVKLINDKVTVLEVYEVSENVDNATGNIHFVGKVVVRGNVRTGFKIECTEDIEVYGVVEGATIIADGNIILHKGIQGHNTGKLISKKEIVSKYMENCYAKANGNITADAIMHCKLESKGSIIASGKKGLIVGGKIRANNEVNAKCIGSPMATITKLEVGIDPEIKERYEGLRQELEVLCKNKESVTKAIQLLTKISKTVTLPKEKQDMLVKSISTEKSLNEKIESVNMNIMNLQNTLQKLSKGRVNVSHKIHPGVRITIGNSVYYVRDDFSSATIVREDGEMKIHPYAGK